MDFTQALARFIGRSVEVFQTTQFIVGTLSGVSEGFFTVQQAPDAYSAGGQVTVLEANIEFVRILPV
ncbi:hypothetical protein L1N85_25500 [Paenibacillus alkaliterrae]|uniref:hypothetical protein n=1 Tax=Paenibacillus alkaliterrae TaxID=320909 RepID=UPI001F33B365|nr:hypothetical protein [Paenibacillus alkaliterrae]MCF2941691.1 hypothetical protein [Paenibacillus alkaliterrae]